MQTKTEGRFANIIIEMGNKVINRRRIILPYGGTAKIAKHFGVTMQTVRNALKFTTDGELPDMIRKEAIQNYGGALSVVKKTTVL